MDALLFTEYYMATAPDVEEHTYYERGGPLFLTIMSPGRYYMNGDTFRGTIAGGVGRMNVDPYFTMERLFRRLEMYCRMENYHCVAENQRTGEGASGYDVVMRMLSRYEVEYGRRRYEEGRDMFTYGRRGFRY